MNTINKKTLEYYDSNADSYIKDTVDADMSTMYRWFTPHLPTGGNILDLGCGTGRDSRAFLSMGYKVTAVDGSVELCAFASKYSGCNVRHILFNELDYKNEFDGIWACASILHVPEVDLPDVFRRISGALKIGGYAYVSFKYGEGEYVRAGRSFTDMTEDRLRKIIEASEGLSIAETKITNDVRKGRETERWLNALITH